MQAGCAEQRDFRGDKNPFPFATVEGITTE
jgi:hypothetical protein